MSVSVRKTARILKRLAAPKVKHYSGLPPELTGGQDLREALEAPALLIMEQRPDGVFLFRFTADGQLVGDTWHLSVEEAEEQARFEFPESLSDWRSVPPDVEDAVAFGLRP